MPRGLIAPLHALTVLILSCLAHSEPTLTSLNRAIAARSSPTAQAHDAPLLFPGALRDPSYLPAEIGGVIAAYGVSLVFVAITLLALAKKRREHLKAAQDEFVFEAPADFCSPDRAPGELHSYPDAARVPNFSYPSPINTDFNVSSPHIYPSPTSTAGAPGVDLAVDQRVVQADREMAQQQLEEMYRHVMEHEEAKENGTVPDAPVIPRPPQNHAPDSMGSKKERSKPASLNLSRGVEEKSHSKAHSFFSALRSPRKKSIKGISISSPIMTPHSSTFPVHDFQEMSPMAPRPYAPAPPAPDQPASVQTIDERISALSGTASGSRQVSQAPTEADPASATSEHSQVPLVGLPSSPKPSAKPPQLPSSPKPGASFRKPNAPSAVRTGGTLPLRAYEPAMSSPSAMAYTTKQTVFERRGPLSPTTGRTPRTAGAVPYSPYQPNTPCIPVTPSLVTKEDRRRMKRMIPKTPTLEMVKSSDDVW
ncbi:uncharacterized protein HRG_07751 [Hirsutella rhossiliensis]|uniref:Uncharacterized protein n=1 Tax=Hirsutella rhossiliensis TaxID=111463 RepID=A0A9P8MTE5_9HYPO|nr:uncharacterized protein HRG_07751 [Hirsutella rhossiliensis]KAH0961673.1 hypothetical protein HRG_07751 [Hirsutella rhossiliensis]